MNKEQKMLHFSQSLNSRNYY